MENVGEKRRRAPNFSPRERCLLLNIIYEFKNIIENKKTDSCTWKENDEAWQKISNIFNSRSTENCHRSKEALRKYYDNIKGAVRKEVAEEKKELNATGGGVKRKQCTDETRELALSIMNKKTLYGLTNPFDGDAEEVEQVQQSATSCVENDEQSEHEHTYALKEIINEPEASTSTDCKNNWAKISASKLKETPSNNMGQSWFKRRRPTMKQSSSKLEEEYSALCKMKMDLCKLEQQQLEAKENREQDLFNLQKKKLLLIIEIKDFKLKNLKTSFIRNMDKQDF